MLYLEEHLLNINVVLISTAAWFILWVLRKVWKGMDTIKLVHRFKPLYPALLCQAFVWLPGALPAQQDPTVGYRILIGFWCGFLASIGYQLVKRFLKPRGVELPDKPEDLLPGAGPGVSSSENVVTGEWETPAISSGKEKIDSVRKEQPSTYTPPKVDDLFKPPKI